MNRPLYQGCAAPQSCPPDGHAGLWFERFFQGYGADWQVGDDTKQGFLDGLNGACGDASALERMALRRAELAAMLGGDHRTLALEGRLVTGLGYPHPVENGFAWHPTLGVPYLTGAAVKGLLRAFCETWDDWATDEPRLARWFGVGAAESAPEEGAGDLIFLEALPVKPPRLQTDIMTPHMGKWYEAGDQVKNPWDEKEAERVPGDWHDPVPIPFLTVEQATFQVAVVPRPRSEAGAGDVEAALDKLAEALEWIGAGGKTAVGYGHMVPDPKQRDAIQDKLESARREQEAAAQAEARKALAPEEQALLAFEDLMAEERQAGITERSQSALPEQAQALMDQAEAEQWPQPLRHRLADLVEAAFSQVGGYSKKRKNAIKAQLARLRGATED